ncbi:MAG: hypothetical protein IPG76_05290 [Acidobacteria bacterium]|nr:hypothetical protein [Acidobacteriota bacterium]
MNIINDPEKHRVYKYYDLVMAAFVTVLLCSAVIGVQKVSVVGPFHIGSFEMTEMGVDSTRGLDADVSDSTRTRSERRQLVQLD